MGEENLLCVKSKISWMFMKKNGKQAVYDNSENNHLAKKDDFAEAIINDKISISDNSWNNFRPIFDLIQQILA